MRALSLKRPWPHCILYLGKRIENRRRADKQEPKWLTRFRGRVCLHASQRWDKRCVGGVVDAGLAVRYTPPDEPLTGPGGVGYPRGYSYPVQVPAILDHEPAHPTGIVGTASIVGDIRPGLKDEAWIYLGPPECTDYQSDTRDRRVCAASPELLDYGMKLDLRWWMGGYGAVLNQVTALATPVPCKGRLGLWRVDRETLAAVVEAAA